MLKQGAVCQLRLAQRSPVPEMLLKPLCCAILLTMSIAEENGRPGMKPGAFRTQFKLDCGDSERSSIYPYSAEACWEKTGKLP